MKNMQIEERHLLLGGGIAVILLTAALVYGVLPAWKSHQTQALEHERLTLLTRGQDMTLLLNQARERSAAAREILDSLLAGKSIGHLESHVMSQLERQAQQHGLQLVAVKPGYADGVPGFEETQFQVRIKGEYFNIFDWLVDMDSTFPYLVIRKLHIFGTSGLSNNPELNVEMTVATYRAAAG